MGDGVTDDWKALQAAVDNFDTVFLPKGFYRLSKPLMLRRKGVSLVGVGKTISFLMPLSDPVRVGPSVRCLPSELVCFSFSTLCKGSLNLGGFCAC
eukprot:COSAG02_NODE_975_length_15507_cov_14.829180_6_plen_96_part_00